MLLGPNGLPLPPMPGSPAGRPDRAIEMAQQAVDAATEKLKAAKQGINERLGGVAQTAGQAMQGASTFVQNPANQRLMGRIGAVGSTLAVGGGEALAGRPLGAVASVPGAILGGILGAPLGPLGVAGGSYLGATLAATGAEALKNKITGEAIGGKPETAGTQQAQYVPGTNIPANEAARQLELAKQTGELGNTQYRDQLGVYTSSLKDLQKFNSDQAYLNLQRNIPLINQIKNADLIRQQQLMNTQTQSYLTQGVLATAGALATGAQQEAGATFRTAITANPYAGSTIQAPSVRFG